MSWVPGLLGVEISPALMFIFSGAGLDPRSFEGLGFRGCERGKVSYPPPCDPTITAASTVPMEDPRLESATTSRMRVMALRQTPLKEIMSEGRASKSFTTGSA